MGGRPRRRRSGGRAQTHLFGIRQALSTVGQKPALLGQKAVWKHSAKCLSRANSPPEIPSWSLCSNTRLPGTLSVCGGWGGSPARR